MRFVLDARYAGARVSGIGNYVRALATRLPALAPEAHFRFWRPPGAAPLSSAPNVSEHAVRAIPNGLRTLLALQYQDDFEPDDVFHAPANVLGFGAPQASVVTVHDLMWIEHTDYCQPNPMLRPISRAYFGTGIRRALAHAARILTVSRASADAIVRYWPDAAPRVVVTPNACEPEFRPAPDRAAARAQAARVLGFEEPFFLVIGQNQPSKGHGIALEAFAAAALPRTRLVFVQRLLPGRGLERRARELGIADRVAFAPALRFEDLLSLLQSAVALLQPSFAEGFGLPALEAAAAGCAVIATDIPPLREVLGDAGTFVPVRSVPALAAAIRRLNDDAALVEELGARGVERSRAFSWDTTASLTWEVYRDVARRGAA